jgi:hypothetical protein
MKTRSHKCPYLRNHRYCDYKGGRGDCIHSKCEDCPLWQHSSTLAENIVRKAPRPLKNDSDRKGEVY